MGRALPDPLPAQTRRLEALFRARHPTPHHPCLRHLTPKGQGTGGHRPGARQGWNTPHTHPLAEKSVPAHLAFLTRRHCPSLRDAASCAEYHPPPCPQEQAQFQEVSWGSPRLPFCSQPSHALVPSCQNLNFLICERAGPQEYGDILLPERQLGLGRRAQAPRARRPRPSLSPSPAPPLPPAERKKASSKCSGSSRGGQLQDTLEFHLPLSYGGLGPGSCPLPRTGQHPSNPASWASHWQALPSRGETSQSAKMSMAMSGSCRTSRMARCSSWALRDGRFSTARGTIESSAKYTSTSGAATEAGQGQLGWCTGAGMSIRNPPPALGLQPPLYTPGGPWKEAGPQHPWEPRKVLSGFTQDPHSTQKPSTSAPGTGLATLQPPKVPIRAGIAPCSLPWKPQVPLCASSLTERIPSAGLRQTG